MSSHPAFGLVTGLRSVELNVADIDANERFYVDTWLLASLGRTGGVCYLRATGAAHHVLALHPAASTSLRSVTLAAASRAAVDTLAARITGAGARVIAAPGPIDEPGGGYGCTFTDPEGRVFRLIADDARHADASTVPDRPERLAHVVLNSTANETAAQFFIEVLGFRLSDRTRIMDFIRCGRDHHSLSFAKGDGPTLNHIAFHMPDLDSVMRGAGRMRDAGFAIEWGVGRHGPGNNVFAYFVAPGDVPVEYTGEVDQVDETYRTGFPNDWTWPPGRIDRWGVSAPPTARLKEAQSSVRFAAPA